MEPVAQAGRGTMLNSTGLVSSHHTIPSPLQLCHELTASPSPQGYTDSCGFWGKTQALLWLGAEDPFPPESANLLDSLDGAPCTPSQQTLHLHIICMCCASFILVPFL